VSRTAQHRNTLLDNAPVLMLEKRLDSDPAGDATGNTAADRLHAQLALPVRADHYSGDSGQTTLTIRADGEFGDLPVLELSRRLVVVAREFLNNRAVLGSATKMRKTRPPF
jgi:hypothetical protein